MKAPSYCDDNTDGSSRYSLTGDSHYDMFKSAYHLSNSYFRRISHVRAEKGYQIMP